ncbi:MFS transporter [Rhodococcoides kyotonense]|uniref:Drug resistance transporter, EmrB/QacA subfamily n=1 Tax=Rhodococcoides kyotonense TaxID=398843 RepID=A0A239H618_9NOCA|nr:MFS transporter [Rhodococcus kyotonensis]SNS76662.1 drug resistance transporter, EmrB/QacA subfamily [Rhodococcus kyotonensis]
MAEPPPPPKTDSYPWRVLSVTGLGMSITFMSVSMLPVALPDMSAGLGASAAQTDWFMLAYLLTTAVLILVLGKVADSIGRRPVYLAGLLLLTVSGAVITVSGDPSLVIALRVVQGVGAAAVITNTTALLVEAFAPEKLAIGIGWNITIMSLAVSVGPLLGGVLTETVGWRGVFAVVVPLGVAGTVWAAMTLRRTPRPRTGSAFDWVGAVGSMVVLGCLVYGVNRGGDDGFGSWTSLLPLLVAAVGLPLFWLWEKRAGDPIVDPKLLIDRFRGSAYGASFLVTMAEGAVAVTMSLYLQSVEGRSPVEAGLQITALAVGTTVMSPIAGRLATRIRTRVLTTVSTLGTATVLAILALHIAGPAAGIPIMAILFALGLTGGVFKTANAAAINVGVPQGRSGMANGLRVSLDNTAVTLSTALALVLAVSTLPPVMRELVYSGDADQLSSAATSSLTTGFVVSVAAMAIAALAATVPSALRGVRGDEPSEIRRTSARTLPSSTTIEN